MDRRIIHGSEIERIDSIRVERESSNGPTTTYTFTGIATTKSGETLDVAWVQNEVRDGRGNVSSIPVSGYRVIDRANVSRLTQIYGRSLDK